MTFRAREEDENGLTPANLPHRYAYFHPKRLTKA
jgi:hypothetical protein